jgi:Tol biopolymer transport system component
VPEAVADVEGDTITQNLAISPDGKFLAYVFTEFGKVPAAGWYIGVWSIEDRALVKKIGAPNAEMVLWSPTGKSLNLVFADKGASNIFEQSLNGAPARRLTNFKSETIYDVSWNADQRKLFMTRGHADGNLVVVRRGR